MGDHAESRIAGLGGILLVVFPRVLYGGRVGHWLLRAPPDGRHALSCPTCTIDDPKIFAAPWSQEFEILAKPEWDKQGLIRVCLRREFPLSGRLMRGEVGDR
jgi:hypothetical protein